MKNLYETLLSIIVKMEYWCTIGVLYAEYSSTIVLSGVSCDLYNIGFPFHDKTSCRSSRMYHCPT